MWQSKIFIEIVFIAIIAIISMTFLLNVMSTSITSFVVTVLFLLFLLVTFKNFILITVFVAIIWEAWLSDYIPLREIYCTRHKNKCLFSSWYNVLQMYFTWINISIGVVFGIEYLPTKKTVGRISSNIQHLWYPNLSIQ